MNLNRDKIITLTVLKSSIDNYSMCGRYNDDMAMTNSAGEQDIFVSSISRTALIKSGLEEGKTLIILKESMENAPVRLIVEESPENIRKKIKEAPSI